MTSYDSSSVRESEEQSLESTVPTDLTLSPESDESRRRQSSLPVTKQLIERKQLIHDVQLLKIELSQKTLLIDNMKAEYMSKTEELQDKLADALNQKQLLQMRLETQINIQAAESKRNIEQLTQEMGNILQKQHQLEQMNEKLREKAGQIKDGLDGVELTESEYLNLKRQTSENISLREHVAIKMYEAAWPFKLDAKMMRNKIKNIQDDAHKRREQLEIINEELLSEKSKTRVLETRLEKVLADLESNNNKIQQDARKIDQFQKVKSERDKLERELLELRKSLSSIQADNVSLKKDVDEFRPEQINTRQKILLLQHDKEYLVKRNEELQMQVGNVEDRLSHMSLQLEKEKEARQEMYERYISARDSYKNEYERKLKEELEDSQSRITSDMDKIRIDMKNLYEQEIKCMKENRDNTSAQRDRAESMLKEVTLKYERLLNDLQQSKSNETNKMADLRSNLKAKTLELDQLKLVHADTTRLLKENQSVNEKLYKKIQTLTEEVYNVKYTTQSNIENLQAQLAEKSTKLMEYEKLENDLDEIVIQSAKATNETEAGLLFILGSKIPTTVNRRLQQCMQLAKQILQIERQNIVLKSELNSKSDQITQISDELESAKSILNQIDQPYSNMVHVIQSKDKVIKEQKELIEKLSNDVRKVLEERTQLEKKSQQQVDDISKLCAHKEELAAMKKILQGLHHDVGYKNMISTKSLK